MMGNYHKLSDINRGAPANSFCHNCRELLEETIYIAEGRLLCLTCADDRIKRLRAHERRIFNYIKRHGNILDTTDKSKSKKGRAVDCKGKPLTWLINKYPKDYESNNIDWDPTYLEDTE